MIVKLRALRVGLASLALATATVGTGAIVAPIAMADYGMVQATTGVNIRTQPTTSAPRLGVLLKGQKLQQVGPTRNGWVPVRYNGKTAWISADYLVGAKAAADAPVTAAGTTGTKKTSANLNVRKGPSTASARIGLLSKGTTVELTGLVSGQFSQIRHQGDRAWVATTYLVDAGASTGATAPTGAKQARATTALMIRTAAGPNFRSLGDIPKGTVVTLTGRSEQGVAQIVWQGALRWVNARYLADLASSPAPTPKPVTTKTTTMYTTAVLNIRTGPEASAKVLGELPKGVAVKYTGTIRQGRAKIIHLGVARWVTAKYLSATAPVADAPQVNSGTTAGGGLTDAEIYSAGWSQGLRGLAPNTDRLLKIIRTKYPHIKTIYGIRPDPIPDHPTGHGLDLMIPNWSTSSARAQTWEIANWLRANAGSLDIKYVIWDQKIWNVQRSREGWRLMSDRGGHTANHKDHIHICTNGV